MNRPIDLNSFATDIAPLVRMFFVSESAERIDDIIRYAYVSREETTKYDTILKSFLRDSIQHSYNPAAKEITTGTNKELLLTPGIRQFQKTLPTTGHMQLLIGSVGSGKSLFCRRYQGFLQPSDVTASTYWTFVDFNKAPENLDGLEGWLCAEFLKSFQEQNPSLDLTELSMLQKIFAPDINKIRKIYAKVAASDRDLVELKIADELAAYSTNPIKFTGELCRFLNGDMRKVVVVVFDYWHFARNRGVSY